MLLIARKPGEAFTLQIGDMAGGSAALDKEIRDAWKHYKFLRHCPFDPQTDKYGIFREKFLLEALFRIRKSRRADIAVRVVVMGYREGRVNLGVDAPAEVRILRDELKAMRVPQ